MSEQRSWDSRQAVDARRTAQVRECRATYTGKPVRIVEWRPDWPPQSEVPHANTVMWDEESEAEVRVWSGIPFPHGDWGWGLDIIDAEGELDARALSDLKPIPPKPETASGEVVGEIRIRTDVPGIARDTFHGIPGTDALAPGTYKLIKVEP